MKKQNSKLNFSKSAIVELNEDNLADVNGGTSPISIASSTVCVRVSIKVISVIITN